jgi:hypothetical protein
VAEEEAVLLSQGILVSIVDIGVGVDVDVVVLI